MNIKHISIPFDELSLFKEEEKYQMYLVQTLIYSTKVTLYSNNNKNKCILIVTKHHLWLQDEKNKKKVIKMQMLGIQNILKSEDHPQFMIFTDENHDNLRIGASNQDKCDNIFSALSYYFNFLAINKRALKIYFIKQNSLVYFERTIKEKKTSSKFNLSRYLCKDINYEEPSNSPDIFGKLVIHKFILLKQYLSQDSHLLHSAKINNQLQLYFCHSIDKDEQLTTKIKQHQNVDFVETLVYSRNLQYKTQLLFEKLSSFEKCTLNLPQIFIQIYNLYDKMKKLDKQAYLCPQLICIDANNNLKLRQFRYHQLIFQYQYKKLIYQKRYKQKNNQDYLQNKMYNIGMILYCYIFGKHLFQHEDIDMTILLKQNAKNINFPQYININYTKKTKIFIQDCIVGKLIDLYAIKEHPWIKYNKIVIN